MNHNAMEPAGWNEFKMLVAKWHENSYVEMLTGKKHLSYARLYAFMVKMIKNALKENALRKLYSIDKRLFFTRIFANSEVAEFFMRHPAPELA